MYFARKNYLRCLAEKNNKFPAESNSSTPPKKNLMVRP
jgi:hypothetical protein